MTAPQWDIPLLDNNMDLHNIRVLRVGHQVMLLLPPLDAGILPPQFDDLFCEAIHAARQAANGSQR